MKSRCRASDDPGRGGKIVKFHHVNLSWLMPDDVPFALDLDRYAFAIKVSIEDGDPVARKFEA
jgi:hypothetical protein